MYVEAGRFRRMGLMRLFITEGEKNLQTILVLCAI